MNFSDIKQNLELLRLGLNSIPVAGEQPVNTMQACFRIVAGLLDECQARIHQEKTAASETVQGGKAET